MWLLGVSVLLLAMICVSVFLGRRSSRAAAEIWDIAGTSRTYTTIVGTLAGFSVTSSIFVANLTVARQSANFEGVMALFLVAFLVFVSSAMQYGTTPNLPPVQGESYRAIQGYSYLLANASFYMGLCLSWLGLPLLLSAVGLDYLGDIFLWLVLFAILGGAMRLSSGGLSIFASMELLPSLALPVLCFVAAALYYFVANELLSAVLPDEHRPALFAVVCFAVGAIGFSVQSAMVGSLRDQRSARFFVGAARHVVIAFTGAVFTAASLLWLAVLSQLY